MFEDILPLAMSGDEKALTVMRAWAAPLRAAVNTLAATFDPDVVILGGGMGHAAVRALEFLVPVKSWFDAEVRPATLGDDAGIIGAGLVAFDLVGDQHTTPSGAGKQLLMVNGVPASGKSSLAHQISKKVGWPVLGLDTLKNPFLEVIEDVDRAFNRTLGKASYKSIFSIIREAPDGTAFIVDAWFGFQPLSLLEEHIEMAGITDVAELWCHAPPDVLAQRYAARAGHRVIGHPGPSYATELVELAKHAGPSRLGPVLDVDTTAWPEIDPIASWVKRALSARKN